MLNDLIQWLDKQEEDMNTYLDTHSARQSMFTKGELKTVQRLKTWLEHREDNDTDGENQSMGFAERVLESPLEDQTNVIRELLHKMNEILMELRSHHQQVRHWLPSKGVGQ